jgi:hypothetical protein
VFARLGCPDIGIRLGKLARDSHAGGVSITRTHTLQRVRLSLGRAEQLCRLVATGAQHIQCCDVL